MDEKTIKTLIEVLVKEIKSLQLDIYLKDLQIEELKKELSEHKLKESERAENDGKL